MILKLFTQPTCGKCPSAKQIVAEVRSKKSDVRIEEYDVTTVDGMAEASFYTVMATPTILVCDNGGKIIKGFSGEAPSIQELTSLL